MSIDLKVNHKLDLALPPPPPEVPDIEEATPEMIQAYRQKKKELMMEQKFKIDMIDAIGASTTDNNGTPFNFITMNNYIIYKVGRHIIIKDCPSEEEEIYSEKEMNKQSNSFFIYISQYSKKITSMEVSLDKNNFAIAEEIEENPKNKYSTISLYSFDKLNIETFYMITPARKILTDKYYNFKSINFSDDNKYICTICNEKITQKFFGVIYNIVEERDFKLNRTEPYIVIDLYKESIKNNPNLNTNIKMTFKKISFDKSSILCITGDNNINFYYIYNSIFSKIPLILNKNYNYIDHTFYKFRSEQKSKDKDGLKTNSVLITITSMNELFIFQSTQKVLESEANFDFAEELNILAGFSGIEQYIVRFHINNIFNDTSCQSEKILAINSNFFCGLVIGNDYGDIVLYEKIKKDDVNNFEYDLIKKYEKKNRTRCTCITANFDKSLALISYEKSETSFINMKKILEAIKTMPQENTLSILNDGYHSYPLKSFEISVQRPIIVTSSFTDNRIKIWNFLSGYSEYCKIILPQGQKLKEKNFVILTLALHPNGFNIVLSDEEMLWFFYICHKEIRFYGNEISEINGNNDEKKKVILQKRNNCYFLKFMNGGDKLLAANNSKNIFIIETFTRQVKNCYHLNHQGKINDVFFTEDNSFIYTFGSDGYIYEVNTITEEFDRIISEILTYTKGFVFSNFDTRFIFNEETEQNESKTQKYHNIIACGYDVKDTYSITEITYIPASLNIEKKELEIVSSSITYLKDQITCLLLIYPKKIDKKCLICGTNDGKIVIYPYPVKDAKYKMDEIYTHNGKITKLNYIKEISMLISCGEDGFFYIYSLFEIFGETVLYEKNFDNIYKLNTALDISLGSSFLFPIAELEKIELAKNEEREVLQKFEEEKDKIEFEHRNRKKTVLEETEKAMEEERNELRKKIEDMEIKMKLNEETLKKNLDKKNNELITNLKNDIRNNCNKLYDYQQEVKALKEKIKSNKKKYKKDIDQRRKDYQIKYKEIQKGFDEKIQNLLEQQKLLKEKYKNEKKDKKAFIINIEKETMLEGKMRSIEQFEKIEEFEIFSENLNYEIIKYKDDVEKLEKKIKEKKKEKEDLTIRAKYLVNRLDYLKKNNSTLTLEKEQTTEEFKNLQYTIQENEAGFQNKKKLRIELYKQKYELMSKYNEKAIDNNIEGDNNKSLSKNIINLTNKVFSSIKDKNKMLSKNELIKKDNERLRTEVNINNQKLEEIILKIFQCFQTNSKGEVIKCLCDIYKMYVNDEFLLKREKKLVDKKIIIELENQVNTLEEQVSLNKIQIKEMKEKHDKYRDEKIKENSILLQRFTKDKNKSQSLEKDINRLEIQSRILNNEISKMQNDMYNISSIMTSNNGSKELKKNVSTNDMLPNINFYKFKNNASVLPSSIINNNEEKTNSKKGSFISKSNFSKIQNSEGLSEHTSFID